MKLYTLRIKNLTKIIPSASLITFEVPVELKDKYRFKPGQFISLSFEHKGEVLNRCYSICSELSSKDLSIVVKRVEKGRGSNYINDCFKIGDEILVGPPSGKFYVNVGTNQYKSYYLFAAGSGITPVISILKSILKEEKSYIYLLFGNTSQETIIFKNELAKLEAKYSQRLVVNYLLSRPRSEWSDLWKNKKYFKGRIDNKSINDFIEKNPPYAQSCEYYICGPGNMISEVKESLKAMDVPERLIFNESFGGNRTQSLTKEIISELTVYVDGSKYKVNVSNKKTLLRSLLEKQINVPYSCEGGVCGSCVCSVKKGQVIMDNNLFLSDEDLKKGKVLSCQSRLTTEVAEVVFE
jgi:ring-1,2-phenylacetyl-CoA epoxidase subunit PaaE